MRKARFWIIGFLGASVIGVGLFLGHRYLSNKKTCDGARRTAIAFFKPGGFSGGRWATRQVGEPVSVRVLGAGTGVDDAVARFILENTSLRPADQSRFNLKTDLAEKVVWVECELSGPRGTVLVRHLSLSGDGDGSRITIPVCVVNGLPGNY